MYYNKNMNIAIITGGVSGERTVSLSSAKNIQKLLEIPDEYIFIYPEDISKIKETVKNIDVALPIIHGIGGEDGEVQILLEELGIPYIFSSPESHQKALSKSTAKSIVSQKGVQAPREYSTDEGITVPCFVKPRSGGSSIYTAVVSTDEELRYFISTHPKIDLLVEEKITGREFTVGIIEKEGKAEALPVIEIISGSDFFDYESKYNTEKLAQEICPADISLDLSGALQRQALLCHKALGCRHLSRTDFMVTDSGGIYFLETNTIPGMTDTSLIPKMARTAGYDLKEIFEEWIHDVLGNEKATT